MVAGLGMLSGDGASVENVSIPHIMHSVFSLGEESYLP